MSDTTHKKDSVAPGTSVRSCDPGHRTRAEYVFSHRFARKKVARSRLFRLCHGHFISRHNLFGVISMVPSLPVIALFNSLDRSLRQGVRVPARKKAERRAYHGAIG